MEQGHEFLARLGKTKLRPGGIDGTNWLLSQVDINEETKILEVACNRAVNMIDWAKKYNCHIEGIDAYDIAIEDAKENIEKENLGNLLNVQIGNAMDLPFEDETFDIVINEAMLTMMNDISKEKCIKEYYRVLKKGGKLLTHDICIENISEDFLREMRAILNIPVAPLPLKSWLEKYENAGFEKIDYKIGELKFLSEEGLLRDEGKEGFERIMENAMKPENIERFSKMRDFFDKDDLEFNYIVISSTK
ncbi:MAG: methyltransferase domain-containing protein [Andreesenia angusta]|nr:methyltransferase domain-containing protein [Andreesenia angusta]